jgi:hypothetical protein
MPKRPAASIALALAHIANAIRWLLRPLKRVRLFRSNRYVTYDFDKSFGRNAR